MNYHVSSRLGGIFHISAAAAVLAALMLAGHYGESINSRIDAKNLPAPGNASSEFVANCAAPPLNAGVTAISCNGPTQNAGLTDIALMSAKIRD